MTHLARQYAEALVVLARKGGDIQALFENLAYVLARRGHQKLLPRIEQEFAMRAKETLYAATARLMVARTKDAAAAERALTETGIPAEQCTLHIDDSLIGGYVYRNQHTMMDSSHKRALLQLYRKLTA